MNLLKTLLAAMAVWDGRGRKIVDNDALLIATTQTLAAATSVTVSATSESLVDLGSYIFDTPAPLVAVIEFPSGAVILSGGSLRIDLYDSSAEAGTYASNSHLALYWSAAAGSSQLASGGATRYYLPIHSVERYVELYFSATYIASTAGVKAWVDAMV